MDFLLQPGYLTMDRAMLLSIKERAERAASIERSADAAIDPVVAEATRDPAISAFDAG